MTVIDRGAVIEAPPLPPARAYTAMNGWDPVGIHPLTTIPLTIKTNPSNDFRPIVVELIIVMLRIFIRNVRGVVII